MTAIIWFERVYGTCKTATVIMTAGTFYAAVTAAATGDVHLEFREQAETISSDTFGIGGTEDDIVLLHRLLLQGEIRSSEDAGLFLQLGAYAENGRNGGPSRVDESAPDVHQAYLDLAVPLLGRLRAGRQEWSLGSGRIVSVRDGPNIRRAFDAVQLEHTFGAASVLLLFGRPVENRRGSFDDRADDAQSLGGVYATFPTDAGTTELYWLDMHRDIGRYAHRGARERRQSWGLRWAATPGQWSMNIEALVQTGSFGSDDIRAWTVATDTRYRFDSIRFAPELGLKADIASGDGDPDDGQLETFNALYPNPSYFSDAALIAPANLVDLQPFVQLRIRRALVLYVGWNVIWKHREADAVYTTPVPLTPVAGTTGTSRFIGQQLQMSTQWQATRHAALEASYVRFFAGSALHEAGGDDVDFLQLKFTLSY